MHLKKDNMILIGLLILIVLVACVCGYFAFQKSESETENKTDAIKIKEEYASLNDKINESNQKQYKTVNLSDENPFVYKTEEEIIKILESKSGIIYFGFKSCPWCRTMISVLEESSKEENLSVIYYLDIENIRDVLSLDENNKIITEKEGTSSYYKILELLDQALEEYTLVGNDGSEVKTNEKRLYAPTVIAVSNGTVESIHVGTVSSQSDPYKDLTEEEETELKEIYKEMIEIVTSLQCDDLC